MTKEQASRRIEEWRIVEATGVWNDFIQGLWDVEKVYYTQLRKQTDEKKVFRAQGAMDIIHMVLNAKNNQVREATEIMDGKKRTTASAARSS